MDGLNSMFCSPKIVEEMKEKIASMTYELQLVKIQKEEQVKKNRESLEDMKRLLKLLRLANKERDEAREKLQILLNNVNSGTAAMAVPVLSSESPSLINNNFQGRTCSGVTESNSYSDITTYNNTKNHNLQHSSQGDSLYDVISPVINDYSTKAISASALPAQLSAVMSRSAASRMTEDTETQIIFNLAKGKTLPQKGKLLQAVMDAGPLLQTLMVAAPLPSWRNPPPHQPIQVSGVNVGGLDGHSKQAAIGPDSGAHLLKRPFNHLFSGCASSEYLTNSMLNFTAGGGLNSARGMLSPAGAGLGSQMIPTPKRQRIQ